MSATGANERGHGENGAGARPSAPWRDDVLRAVLTLGAVVAPLSALLAVTLAPGRSALDRLVIVVAGLLMPVLRFTPGLSYGVRALGTIAALFSAGAFVLSRMGLSPGAAMLFAVASIFAALYFGRAAGYAIMAIGAATFVVVGWAVGTGRLAISTEVFEATSFRNWVRVGAIYGLLSSMLVATVTFVIGRVEAGARDLRVAYERLGQLHLRLESTKEEERRFLAHELHDELGQLLTALKLRIQLNQRRAGFPAGGLDGADPIDLIDDLISRVRRMSGDLRPPLLDEVGLIPAVRAYVDTQSALSGVAMSLETNESAADPSAPRLAPEIEITCFRIVQEAITNAIRHAGARDLRVRVERTADRLSLRVADDGRGFDVDVRLEGAAAAGHLGVVGMRERVRAHGGGFQLRSRPGAGTTIEVELPLIPRPLGVPS